MEYLLLTSQNKANHKNKYQLFVALIPLVSAILLDAHIRFLTLKLHSTLEYFDLLAQLCVQSLPFFIAVIAAINGKKSKAVLFWLSGFLIYPLLLLIVKENSNVFLDRYFLGLQGWIFAVLASLCVLIIGKNNKLIKTNKPWIKRLLELDAIVFIVFLGWALLMAAIFSSHIAPMYNQPFNLLINFELIFQNLGDFLGYVWQFQLIALCLYGLYWCNRYVLIRIMLSHYGLLAFISLSFLLLLTFTPFLTYLTLLLPINDLPEHIPNLTPGGNQNIFNPVNYQFSFIFLLISTPIILTFERQVHQAQLNKITQQQVQTELKLLQQQINPHFLFNTLNNLYALTLTKSDTAPDLVMQLSSLLRYSVYDGAKPWVNLQDEVTYMKNFIALQQIRSGNKCKFDTSWPNKATQASIPPLLLITLLENAVKHGVEPALDKVTVQYSLHLTGSTLNVVCKNPIIKNKHTEVGGFGLANLQKRLDLLFPNRHHLSHSQDNNVWTSTLSMELPPC